MPYLSYTCRDGIARILLEHPPVNALTEPLIDALLEALARAARDPEAHAVVLGSAVPGRFCAGLDLIALDGQPPEAMHDLVEKLYVRMTDAQFQLGKPSIAAVGGTARGGGMTLAISCDLVVAERSASFGYPEIDVGVLPAIHFAHLPRIVGKHRAFELLFTARAFDAAEAHRLGLVNRVVDDGQALTEALALAAQLAAKPRRAMRAGRAAFLREFHPDYRHQVAAAVENFSSVAATEEARRAIGGFVARRRQKP